MTNGMREQDTTDTTERHDHADAMQDETGSRPACCRLQAGVLLEHGC